MSYKKTFLIIWSLCCMLPASLFADAYGNKHQVNITGATLFKSFFLAPASTNDDIDVDGDGHYGFNPDDFNLPDQLAFSTWNSNDPNNRWIVMYRGSGSGNGLAELDLFCRSAPTMDQNVFPYPSDSGFINRNTWCNLGVLQGDGNSANPGGAPIPPNNMDIATMDVPPIWFVVDGNQADAYWQAYPQDHVNGYGRCPITSWDANQSNKLKTLTNLNLNMSNPDGNTIFDTQVAWVPIAIIANQGTGLQNVTEADMQYLFLAGRMSSGENLYACTRDSGSGTRNGMMNSIGADPSWGRGDNMGKKSNAAITSVGPGHQHDNLDGSGLMEVAVQNFRLGVGYTGLTRANTVAAAGKVEILNFEKTGATQFVRPSRNDTVDTSDPNTGWQIGGNETMATVGDPNKAGSNPQMFNPYAADYVWNIKKSIDFFTEPNGSDQNNMPGQYLAANFSLAAALTAVPSQVPDVFVPNPNYSDNLNQYYKKHGPLTPDFGIVPDGKVPTRTIRSDANYSDGTKGANYIFSDGVVRNSATNLNDRNHIMGDFSNDGKRDINDINAMMLAFSSPRTFEDVNHGNTGVCPEIIGDFTADGNFSTDDIRYFADGLALRSTANGLQLDRSMGFQMVDQYWTAARAATLGDANHPAGNFFNTTLATGRPYEPNSGWSKGDIAGPNWKTVNPTIGYTPSADGKIDANDIDYLCWILRGGLKAKYFGTTLPADSNVYKKSLHWSNLDDAVFMDLSCDLNGDLVVDFNDVRTLVVDILGTNFGDVDLDGKVDANDLAIATAHLGQQGGWAQGDMDGDGWVTQNDIDIIKRGMADFNGDGVVNYQDLEIFAEEWLTNETGGPDLNGDGFVNFVDFAIFANNWLKNVVIDP